MAKIASSRDFNELALFGSAGYDKSYGLNCFTKAVFALMIVCLIIVQPI